MSNEYTEVEELRNENAAWQRSSESMLAEIDALKEKYKTQNSEFMTYIRDTGNDLDAMERRIKELEIVLEWIADNDPKGKSDAYYHSEQSGARARAVLGS